MDGQPVAEPTQVVVVEPIRLPNDHVIFFQAPFVTPFYLLKAKQLRDAAEPKRIRALENPVRTPDGTFRPRRPGPVFDALEDLALSVFLSIAGIEAYANGVIGRLPDDAMVELPHRIAGQTMYVARAKPAMEWLSLAEKISYVVPLATGRESIRGTVAWQPFRRLRRLRNGIVHVKREAYSDPDQPGPFGRLLLGEGSTAPDDAVATIEALEPGWLPSSVREAFGLPDA
jgi:hypothetical protein